MHAAGTQNAGIHSHGDGLIHTHPFVQSEAGNNATLGKYADGDWSVSSDSIGVDGPASATEVVEQRRHLHLRRHKGKQGSWCGRSTAR